MSSFVVLFFLSCFRNFARDVIYIVLLSSIVLPGQASKMLDRNPAYSCTFLDGSSITGTDGRYNVEIVMQTRGNNGSPLMDPYNLKIAVEVQRCNLTLFFFGAFSSFVLFFFSQCIYSVLFFLSSFSLPVLFVLISKCLFVQSIVSAGVTYEYNEPGPHRPLIVTSAGTEVPEAQIEFIDQTSITMSGTLRFTSDESPFCSDCNGVPDLEVALAEGDGEFGVYTPVKGTLISVTTQAVINNSLRRFSSFLCVSKTCYF